MSGPPPTSSQSHDSGGPPVTGDAGPPSAPPAFPSAQPEQVEPPDAHQAQSTIPTGDVQQGTPIRTQGMTSPGRQPQSPNMPRQVGQPPVPQLFTPYTPTNNLVRPIPGTINRAPEEITREIGWLALSEAITQASVSLYPDDPQAVAVTVADTPQPYLQSFGRGPAINPSTQGSPAQNGQSLSKTTENIILGALTGKKSQEVGKYQHTFPSFPGDSCRDDVDLWERYWESGECFGFSKGGQM